MPRQIEVYEAAEVRAVFEAEVARVGVGKFAKRAGTSAAVVSRARSGDPLGVAIPLALGFRKLVVYERVVPARRAAALEPGDLAVVERMFGSGSAAPSADDLLAGIAPGVARPHRKPRPVPVPVSAMVEVEPEVAITEEALGNRALALPGEEDE